MKIYELNDREQDGESQKNIFLNQEWISIKD